MELRPILGSNSNHKKGLDYYKNWLHEISVISNFKKDFYALVRYIFFFIRFSFSPLSCYNNSCKIISNYFCFYFKECIPDPSNLDSDPEMAKIVVKLRKTLQEACQPAPKQPPPNYDLVQSKVTLQSLGLTLGDKVMVGGLKVSITSI